MYRVLSLRPLSLGARRTFLTEQFWCVRIEGVFMVIVGVMSYHYTFWDTDIFVESRFEGRIMKF